MRRLIAFAGAVAGLACANLSAPPGGPQRKLPPELLTVTPESGAVNVKDKYVVFSFDVIVDDHSGRGGKLANSFIVSPNEGSPVVNWKRDRVEVRPKGGFRPDMAYSITMLPGISDLNRNVLNNSRVITFSTGPTIPPYAIHGRVFDWMSERTAKDALIDVIRLPDSIPYVGVTDTSGQFLIGPLDSGTYLVHALMDNNHNGLRDPNETWDSTTVVVKTESPFVELRAAVRDTLPPRLLTVLPIDSLTLGLSFDRLLDPAAPLTPALVRVQRADSTTLVVARIHTQAQFQRIRFSRDSVREVARLDSIAKADTSARRPAAPAPAEAIGQRGPATVVVPKPSVPGPSRDLVIELEATSPLVPMSSYRVTALGLRSLTGVSRTSERVVNIPRRDTTKVAPKSP